MTRLKFTLMALGFLLCQIGHALQSAHLLWEKVPLTIELPLNQERLIQFPQPVKIIDQHLGNGLDVLKVKSSLYLKAQATFKEARLIVQLLPAGEVIILNLKADPQFCNSTPIEILIDNASQNPPAGSSHYEYNAIQLTRFAIQTLYSPERVREIPAGVYRSPMRTHKSVSLFYGASVAAYPIASWRGGHLYVTAVELKNLLDKPIELKYDQLMGNWQTASFYPTTLLSDRSKHQSSTVFLVSDRPFHEALNQQGRFSR